MCGKKYNKKYTLNRHLNYECGVDPRFTCDICLKKFSYKDKMILHKGMVHRIAPTDVDTTNVF